LFLAAGAFFFGLAAVALSLRIVDLACLACLACLALSFFYAFCLISLRKESLVTTSPNFRSFRTREFIGVGTDAGG
jgi:hypothetical protein